MNANPYARAQRLILIVMAALLSLVAAGCGKRPPLGIPDGVYRDDGGLAVLTLRGRSAVLETTLLGAPLTMAGEGGLSADGRFSLSGGFASNQWHAVFGQRRWTWEKDHFVVEEKVPPGRTLKLMRR